MLSLTELANKHGSDKGTEGPSRYWPAHNYTDVYEAYLGGLRQEPIRVLEVGLGIPGDQWEAQVAHGRNAIGGASMKMWYDYFPKATIFGADIHDASFLDNDRITTFMVDQGKADTLVDMAERVGGQFDVIFDDGSHRADHQQITFAALFPYLKPGGLYIIEDLMNNGFGDNRSGRFATDEVINTRRVFRRFVNEGQFPTPHLLGDNAEALGADILNVAFHTPWITISSEISLSPKGGVRTPEHPVTTYQAGTEAMCAIRKRA